MQALLEIFFHIFLEIISYPVGKFVSRIVFPNISIETDKSVKSHKSWKWDGFTYTRGSKKYFYIEGLQVIGVLSMFTIAIGIIIIFRGMISVK